jgi:transketolase
MVQSTLKAAEMLKEDGIDITVVDVCAIKPADEEGIARVLEDHETIFTVEEHSVLGGLGSLVCEIAADRCPRKIHRIGMYGFGESADWKTLLKEYNLDGEGVYNQIKGYL